MENEITCKLTPKFIKPFTKKKKVWSAKKVPRTFYKPFRSSKINNLIKDTIVPEEIKKILNLLDCMSSDNGALTIDTSVDHALIFMILTHKNAHFIKKIRFKSFEKYSIEEIKSQYLKQTEDFEALFSVSIPEEIFQILLFYNTFQSALNKKEIDNGNLGVDICLNGFEFPEGIFRSIFTSTPLESNDILLERHGHQDLSYFPAFGYGSDGVSHGFVFDHQLNVFTSCAWFGDGRYTGDKGLWDVFLDSLWLKGDFEEELMCLLANREFDLFYEGKLRLEYKDLNLYLERSECLTAWIINFFVADFLNNNEILNLKFSLANKERYNDTSFNGPWHTSSYNLSRNKTYYVADTYPKPVLSIKQNFHPLFTYQQIDDLVSVFDLIGSKGDLIELFGSKAPILKQLDLSKYFMKNISRRVTKKMWHEFYDATVDFAEQESVEKRYGLALLIGLLIWNRTEKETTNYAVRLLTGLPDDVCHPLIKTLVKKHGKTRFDPQIHY